MNKDRLAKQRRQTNEVRPAPPPPVSASNRSNASFISSLFGAASNASSKRRHCLLFLSGGLAHRVSPIDNRQQQRLTYSNQITDRIFSQREKRFFSCQIECSSTVIILVDLVALVDLEHFVDEQSSSNITSGQHQHSRWSFSRWIHSCKACSASRNLVIVSITPRFLVVCLVACLFSFHRHLWLIPHFRSNRLNWAHFSLLDLPLLVKDNYLAIPLSLSKQTKNQSISFVIKTSNSLDTFVPARFSFLSVDDITPLVFRLVSWCPSPVEEELHSFLFRLCFRSETNTSNPFDAFRALSTLSSLSIHYLFVCVRLRVYVCVYVERQVCTNCNFIDAHSSRYSFTCVLQIKCIWPKEITKHRRYTRLFSSTCWNIRPCR